MENANFKSSTRGKKISYTDDVMKSLIVSRVFKDKSSVVNGVDWDKEGETFITSSDDESVHFYSINKGDLSKTLHSKKYGVDMIKFAHRGVRMCVCASKNAQQNVEAGYAIRLWDLVENRYIRYFPLNTPVIRGNGLNVHPNRSMMIASCYDGVIRLYSLEQEHPLIGIKTQTNRPTAAFDSTGSIFACYAGKSFIHLFDCNHFSKGEFEVLDVSNWLLHDDQIYHILFSPEGKYMCILTTSNKLLKINAFDGQMSGEFSFDADISTSSTFSSNQNQMIIGYPSFSPDGKYLVCGGPQNDIYIWRTSDQKLVNKLNGHAGLPQFVQFNPKKALLASACLNVAWWQPMI